MTPPLSMGIVAGGIVALHPPTPAWSRHVFETTSHESERDINPLSDGAQQGCADINLKG
jgi:hypothetical protein